MLLYALLHLTGYDLPLDDLRALPAVGQPHARAIPEQHLTPGVEATTGPLGQGIANAVGLAIAEAHLGRPLQPARATTSSTTTRGSWPATAT